MPRGRPRKYGPFLPGKEPAYMRKQLQVVKKKVNQLSNNVETKHCQFVDSFSIHNSGVNRVINTITVGTAQGQRTGSVVAMKSMYFKYQVQFSATPQEQSFRVMIAYLKDSGFVTTGFLQSLGGTLAPISNYVPESQKDYVLLYDKIHRLTAGDSNYIVAGKKRINLRGKKNIYDSGTNTVQYGTMVVFAVAQTASGAATNPVMSFTSDISYID